VDPSSQRILESLERLILSLARLAPDQRRRIVRRLAREGMLSARSGREGRGDQKSCP
jgi:hypothetical protein